MVARIVVVAAVAAIALVSLVAAADEQPICSVNQLFNGQICTCAPGYFSSQNDESKSRCQDECEEVYFSFFTYGQCVKNIFDRVAEDQQPACNLRCGIRLRLWASIALFVVIAAAIATLVFTLPMCIATCSSCLNARKANKNAKRVYVEQQAAAAPSKEQQLATYGGAQGQYGGYNPYAFWPYYGRTA